MPVLSYVLTRQAKCYYEWAFLVAVEMDHWESKCRARQVPGKPASKGSFHVCSESWGLRLGGERLPLHREFTVVGAGRCFEVPRAGPDITMATSSSRLAWDHPAFCTESPEARNPGHLRQPASGRPQTQPRPARGPPSQSGHMGLAYQVLCWRCILHVSQQPGTPDTSPSSELAGQLLHLKAAAASGRLWAGLH